MGSLTRSGTIALALLAGIGFASAQQPAKDAAKDTAAAQGQQENANKAVHSESGKAGKEEPSSHEPTPKPDENTALFNGALAVPGAPVDSQTVPAKFSQRNAALDDLPIVAMPLGLSDNDKRRVVESLQRTGSPESTITTKVSQELPAGVEMRELSPEVTQIPQLRGLKYVRTADRILLVRAPNRIVVGEITP